jgi:hypothetical protein
VPALSLASMWILFIMSQVLNGAQTLLSDWENKRKQWVMGGIVVALFVIGFIVKRSDDADAKTAEANLSTATNLLNVATNQLAGASNEVAGLRTALAKQVEVSEAALKRADSNETFVKWIRLERNSDQINAANNAERLLNKFQELSTTKFDPKIGWESLSNRLELARLEKEKSRMEAELAKPAQEAEAEKQKLKREQDRLQMVEYRVNRFLPFVDYTVTSLLLMLRDANEGTTESKIRSTCGDLRSLLKSNGQCEIIGPGEEWLYQVKVSDFLNLSQFTPSIRLQITCMDGQSKVPSSPSYTNMLDVVFPIRSAKSDYGGTIAFSMVNKSQQETINDPLPMDYTNAMRKALGYLISAQPEYRTNPPPRAQ